MTALASSTSNKKQPAIHKIRELQLDTVNIEANYDVLKEIGSGDYGKVILAVHKLSGIEVAHISYRLSLIGAFPFKR